MLESSTQLVHPRQGANPLLQTARGRLQTRRSKLNDKINREIQLRNGAENLLEAMNDKKLKVQVALELSFFNSNIQLYKEELSDVNSSFDIYQYGSEAVTTPMLPVGLKETKEVDFSMPFMDFIQEHYSENGENYETEIRTLSDIRQNMRTPTRDSEGIRINLEYFNLLHFVEKRFFSPERKLPVFFHWYDSLTGVPVTQKSMAYERACVMYNTAALHTQIACKQDHTMPEGLDAAVRHFQLAAGAFKYVRDSFNNAPSIDMQPLVLSCLVHIMLAQAQECIFERCLLGGLPSNLSSHVTIAQEASMLSKVYGETHVMISDKSLLDILPLSWVSMVKVKYLYYQALSHYYLATGLLDHPAAEGTDTNHTSTSLTPVLASVPTDDCVYIPSDPRQHYANGKAHLRQALILHADALRDHETCKHLRKIDTFKDILQLAHDRTLERYESLEVEDDFSDLSEQQPITPWSHDQACSTAPDLSLYTVRDIFASLGPLSAFNAKNHWTSPRLVTMCPTDRGYGFSVGGHSPVTLVQVDKGSPAHIAGLKVNDIILAVEGNDTKWLSHVQVVELILAAGQRLKLKIVSPMSRQDSTQVPPDCGTTRRSLSMPCMRAESVVGSVRSHTSTKSSKWLSITRLFSRHSSNKSDKFEKSLSFHRDIMLR